MVLDASAAVLFLSRGDGGAGDRVSDRLRSSRSGVWAPHLIDAEVGHAFRRLVRLGRLSATDASDGLRDLLVVPVRRVPHTAFVARALTARRR